MAECNFHNMYPNRSATPSNLSANTSNLSANTSNLSANLSNDQLFRLNKVNETKDYFIAGIKER